MLLSRQTDHLLKTQSTHIHFILEKYSLLVQTQGRVSSRGGGNVTIIVTCNLEYYHSKLLLCGKGTYTLGELTSGVSFII